ncbi:MAG: hypothetical protein JNL39_12430 [Opitutaceae bacterium]|nr:hypothetical protein [Opitutaceae bacterium]
MKMKSALAPALLALAAPLAAADTLVFSDDFNRTEAGAAWRFLWPEVALADGTLHARQAKAGHGAVARCNAAMRDGALEFRFRLSPGTSLNAVWNDPAYKESHGGHICRVAISEKQIRLGDDKLGLTHETVAMRRDPALRAEGDRRLAARSATIPRAIAPGEWHLLRMAINGEEMRVSLDGKEVGSLKSAGLAHPVKRDLHFTITGKEAWIDDVRVWSTPP